jgi:prophage regulatory protein
MSPKKFITTLEEIATKAINAPTDPPQPNESFDLLPEVMSLTGKSRASIYADMAAGTFPLSVPLGPRKVGWVHSEVQTWIRNKIAAARNGTDVRKSPKFARTKEGTFKHRAG